MDRELKSFLAIGGGLLATAGLVRAVRRNARQISLRDKVVLITGGSRGFGLVIARELSRLGARVAICARNKRGLSRVRDEFSECGKEIVTEACDVGLR